MLQDRLKKLAGNIDALVARDERLLDQSREIMALRRKAALELHTTCAELVSALNALLSKVSVQLDPPEFSPQGFQEDGPNLFQINVRGRLLQFEFCATPEMVSTEDFRVPYTLVGSIRCFNQLLLEQDVIEEQAIFYCLERSRHFWRFFDERTYRTGAVDVAYLASLLEKLV